MKSWNERAARLFPNASNGEYGIPAERVPIIERGAGCRVVDTEGREWLDMTMAWGAALPGHGYAPIVEAAASAARDGANFAAITRRLVELAERLQQISPFLERVRFVASGTEATMLCLRVARAATGRPKILKFDGAYHGQHPEGVAGMLAGNRGSSSMADGSGTGAPWVERDVLVTPYNDGAGARAMIEAHRDELAAVIVEPLHRCLPPADGFLEELRSVTRACGVVLVFDEVVTGFRLALGGAVERYGVTPDLVAYGKGLGGGFPIGAYGGDAALMEVVSETRIAESNYAWSASTSGGNPVTAAAALAALDLYSQDGFYDEMNGRGERFRAMMTEVLSERGETARVLGEGPLGQVAFTDGPVSNSADWRGTDRARGRALMLALLDEGVFLNPMGTKLYLSWAHEDGVIDEFGEKLREALGRIDRLA